MALAPKRGLATFLLGWSPTWCPENAPLMSALQESVGHYLDPERPHLESDLEEPERWIDNFTRGISVLRARLAG